jgi:hypothetical protein
MAESAVAVQDYLGFLPVAVAVVPVLDSVSVEMVEMGRSK